MSPRSYEPSAYIATILSSYQDFWDRLSGSQNIEADEEDEEISEYIIDGKIIVGTVNNEGRLSDENYLKFKGVKYNPRNPDDLMDICLQFRHTIEAEGDPEEPKLSIEEGVTAVSYLRYDGGPEDYNEDGRRPVRVMTSLHFDYKRAPDRNHPIFHAQYHPQSIKFHVLSDNYEILNSDAHLNSVNPSFPRVPSPPMDISAVVYTILKDRADEHLEWPSNVVAAINRLPDFATDCFTPNPQAGRVMHPEWWYVHASGNDHLSEELTECRKYRS